MTKGAPRATSVASLSPSLASSLDEQIQKLRGEIIERAYTHAESREPTRIAAATPAGSAVPIDVSLQDVSTAFDEAVGQSYQTGGITRFFDIFSPFTCICFLLCAVFGLFGYLALKTTDVRLAAQASGFLDIAKIFAGALVGATSSTALAAIKSRRRVN
jgi:hypothetical protein